MTELEKLQQWYDQEKAKGLLDIRVSLSPGSELNEATIENIAQEMNQINTAFISGKTTRVDVF